MSSQYSTDQVMMTLAQLAATAPIERPSGETVEQQEQRILNGINNQLANASLGLATETQWQAVWVGLTQDRANLAYIAQNLLSNAFAVSIRGTQFTSLVDLAEDLNVAQVAQFTAAYPASAPPADPILVSQGSMEAFAEITSAVYVPNRTTLLQALTILIANSPANPTLYVTGHSLGGAMATMVALYLAAQTWSNPPTYAIYTFAAPTAGLQAFAAYYDSIFPTNSWRYYNVWDLVPNAWGPSDMTNVLATYYPSPAAKSPTVGPGPAQSVAINQLISQFSSAPGANVYVQTNQSANAVQINTAPDYGTVDSITYDPACICPTTADYLGQVSYQHNSYLQMLGAPTIPSAVPTVGYTGLGNPVVPITPNTGSVEGGTAITITGTNFSPDSVVDFGSVPAAWTAVASEGVIFAVSPAGAGTCDVRVTNMFGTSAATAADQFTAPATGQAPVVTAISPSSGPAEAGYSVTLTGAGFSSNCQVYFGDNLATQAVIVSLTEISAAPPTSGSGTVTVTVTTTGSPGGASAPTFTYGPPVVTGVNPCCGIYEGALSKTFNPNITITGAGFGTTQGEGSVQIGNKTATIVSWSDTTIVATPPNYSVLQGAMSQSFDVQVFLSETVSSETTLADTYTYYNSSLIYG